MSRLSLICVTVTPMILLEDNSWEIQKTKKKGWGVFTKEQIQAGTVIGDYLGKIIKTAEYDLENDKKGLFLMYFSDKASIYPDLEKPDIHLLNHSCNPNCWIYVYKGHTLFFTLRAVNPGEELTISYLLGPDENCSPCTHFCMCESLNCTGTMHLSNEKFKLWSSFQKKENLKTKKTKIIYGKSLPQLKNYPHFIPIESIYAKMILPTS